MNQSQEIHYGTGGTGVYFLNSSPPLNYVSKEVIPEISGHDSDKLTENDSSFWASLDSGVDEEIRCDDNSSAD